MPRTEINHETDSTTSVCGCQEKRIGKDVAEKIDYTPGGFSVELHGCVNLVCQSSETLVTAHVIVKYGLIA